MVSIIVPCLNEEKYIGKCISSILKNTFYDFELIIIDGGSKDASVQIISQHMQSDKRIKLLYNKNKITPISLNMGIKNAAGDIISILGAHSIPNPDWIEQSMAVLKKHPEVAAVGGILNTKSDNYLGKIISVAMSSKFGVGNARFRVGGNESYVDTVVFGFYRKDIFKKYGYFDETLPTNQDDDFNMRLTSNHEKLLFSPDIKCDYFSRPTLKHLVFQYFKYGYYKPTVWMNNKHLGSVRQVVPALSVLFFLIFLSISFYNTLFLFYLFYLCTAYLLLGYIFAITNFNKLNNNSISLLLFPIVCLVIHSCYGLGSFISILKLPVYLILNKFKNNAQRS